MSVTGDLDKAVETFREWEENYPRDDIPYNNLSTVYSAQGKVEPGLEQARLSLRLNPDNVISAENLMGFLVTLQRYDEARQVFTQTLARGMDDDALHQVRYGLAFIQGDSKAMAEQAAWYETHPEVQNAILGLQSDTEAYAGRLSKAREMTRAAVESAMRADNKESAALWLVSAAWRESLLGNPEEARSDVHKGLALAPESRDTQILGALTLARAADVPQARSMEQRISQQYPAHTVVRSYWVPTIDAQIALSSNQPQTALEQLQKTANMEIALASAFSNSSCAYPNYLRGEAYLAAGQGSGAAAEFQKIIDRPGLVWNCVTGALAHLELGRAEAVAGDKAKARAAYQDFLTLWKDADPDIPILKEAKAEFARLQ